MQVEPNGHRSRATAALLYKAVRPLLNTCSTPACTSEATPPKIDYGTLNAKKWIHVVIELIVRSRQQLMMPACRKKAPCELLVDEDYTSLYVIAVSRVCPTRISHAEKLDLL